MSDFQNLALSFFPLLHQEFEFSIYRRIYQPSEQKENFAECSRRRLPIAPIENRNDVSYRSYWVSFTKRDNFEIYRCESHTNIHLTNDYLFRCLRNVCSQNLTNEEFKDTKRFNLRRIFFILDTFPEGEQTVWLEPYFLKSKKLFGFLADFKFDAKPNSKLSRRSLQLSLSLDKDGRSNKNFYVERYEKIQQFVASYFSRISELTEYISIKKSLADLPVQTLETKRYVFANSRSESSQFKGIKNHSPLNTINNDTKVYFLYLEKDRPFSHDLFRALRGDTFSHNFPGMEKMFCYPFNASNVGGTTVSDLTPEGLEVAIQTIKQDSNGRPVVPILIVPFDRFESSISSKDYYIAKHTFLKHNIPSQFVSLKLLQQKNQLKWAVSNIGLALFAKMGGQPWKVIPKTDRCLIVGIGQAHKRNQNIIEKYFAYSILTESNGLYKELKILGETTQAETYIATFKRNLKTVLDKYYQDYDSFVVHATFSIRYQELEAIEQVLQSLDNSHERKKEFVVMKFNDKNKFFAYSKGSNSLIPYESSYTNLSPSEYLVWFEGLQYHNPNVRNRIERPIHVEFKFASPELGEQRKTDYLQDALNISGANWRGFNAKSLPISVYYAHLVAEYYKEFHSLKLDSINLEALSPWFL